MNFSKFIPYYHHHFGRQCRVADYGFTKLIELFEAIPHVVKVVTSLGRLILPDLSNLNAVFSLITHSNNREDCLSSTQNVQYMRGYLYGFSR